MDRAQGCIRIVALLFVCAPLYACEAASPRLADSAPIAWSGTAKTIVLATPDIELSELTAGGAEAPRSDWTKTAIDLTAKNIAATLGTRGVTVIQADTRTDARMSQVVKLNSAVGQAILLRCLAPLCHGGTGAECPGPAHRRAGGVDRRIVARRK